MCNGSSERAGEKFSLREMFEKCARFPCVFRGDHFLPARLLAACVVHRPICAVFLLTVAVLEETKLEKFLKKLCRKLATVALYL